MIYRFLSIIALFGFILAMVGCVCAGGDSNPIDGENKLPLSQKQQKEVENIRPESDNAQKYVPGQVLVRLKPGVEPSVLDTIAEKLGLETIQPLALPGTYLMKITGDESVESIIKKLELYDTVVYGEPNYIIKTE